MKSEIDRRMSDPNYIRAAIQEIKDEEFEELSMGGDDMNIANFFYFHIRKFCQREIEQWMT